MLRPGPWLNGGTDVGVAVARRALSDVGILEDPLGSNSSAEIDDYLRRIGVPLKNPWCAAAVSKWFDDGGATRPPGALGCSCDEWMKWAIEHKLWQPTPAVGSAAVYGKEGDAQHIGVVVRLTPKLLTIEGNTKLDSSPTREGIAVDLKELNLGWLLGYVRAVPAT